ncbi:arrestin domain-containing protein A-like [Saccoglossus kowalevskii]
MNQISLRTEKGEYSGGETIFGVVYLRIATATVAQAIQLNLKGFESSDFFQPKKHTSFKAYAEEGIPETAESHKPKDAKNDISISLNTDTYSEVLKGLKYYFNTSVSLWEEKGPLPRGHYVIPFQYNLPPDIPGSFFKEEVGHKIWKGVVKYTVKAFILESDEPIEYTQPIIIQPTNIFSEKLLSPKPTKVTGIVKKCFCYSRGEVHVEAKLNKSIYNSGDIAKLEVLIDNQSTEDIDVIRVTLRRVVRLLGWWRNGNGSEEDVYSDNSEMEDFNGKPPVSVFPKTSEIVWASLLQGCPKSEKNKMHKRLIDIPLIETLASNDHVVPLLPSTLGSLVRCAYCISVDVDVPYAPDITVTLSIDAIKSTSNEQWAQWTPPDWMTQCQVKHSLGECSVRQSVLGSEVFAAIPPFQPT